MKVVVLVGTRGLTEEGGRGREIGLLFRRGIYTVVLSLMDCETFCETF